MYDISLHCYEKGTLACLRLQPTLETALLCVGSSAGSRDVSLEYGPIVALTIEDKES